MDPEPNNKKNEERNSLSNADSVKPRKGVRPIREWVICLSTGQDYAAHQALYPSAVTRMDKEGSKTGIGTATALLDTVGYFSVGGRLEDEEGACPPG